MTTSYSRMFLAFLLLLVLPLLKADSPSIYKIDGYVSIEESLPNVKLSQARVFLDGGGRVAFPRQDGYFSFQNVTAGTHLLEVSAMGAAFLPVRVDVSARLNGWMKASIAGDRSQVIPSDPLVIHSQGAEIYYEERPPFSVWSLLRSPMGLMVAFMAVVVVVLPKLVDSIDPEEMKEMQDQMKGQPSVASLLTGGGSGAGRKGAGTSSAVTRR